MDIIEVVCGIIYNDEKIFLCRRHPKKTLGGYWEFPGGKIEPGESHEKALKRELREEMNMKVDIINYFETHIHDYKKFTVKLIAYKCHLIDWDYSLLDHDAFEWVHRKDLKRWNLAPADIPIANKLINES